MKLYYAPGACSLSPHIVLREAGIPIELKKVSLGSKQIDGGGDYLKINPNGYVPALQLDDGQVLTEGPAIVQYIADNKPGSNLAPPNGTLARARLQGWLNFIATELHKSFSPLFNKAASADWKQAASTLLNKRLSWLDGELNGKTDRRSVHGGGCVFIHHFELDRLRRYRSYAMATIGRLSRPRSGSAAGARGPESRRLKQVK
jgi:glutathione S-transferase